MFRLSTWFIKTLNHNFTRTLHLVHTSSSPKVLSPVRLTPLPLPAPQLSIITHRKVTDLISMQSDPHSESTQTCRPKSSPAGRRDTTEAAAETKKVKKVKNPKKVRERKKKEKECTENLLAELPFTNTKIWKELGFAGGESSTKKKRKRAEKGRVESEEDGEKDKKKKKNTPRPNYFVSIPITNPQIKQTVEELQAEVLLKDPRLSRALIPTGSLHLTLLVTHLSTQEDIHTASLALEEVQPTVMSLLGGRSLVLPFRGVGHFRQEVAFIQIQEGEHLTILNNIAESVRRAFEEKGISSGDQKDFKPHLTFIKLSRAPKLRRQGVKKLDAGVWAQFERSVFGEECVCTLDLCSMLKKKSSDGYYHREKTVTFSAKRAPDLDDEELVSLSKRLVEDAVFRAVQQYMEETQQNGSAPKEEAPPPQTTTNK